MIIKKYLFQPKPKYGFTIIEVVLVLAIAGLIFLMVFVALPALQRSQRDAQRRNDMARIVAALENKRVNNGGILKIVNDDRGWLALTGGPNSNFNNLYLSILGDNAYDPSGEKYKLYFAACVNNKPIRNPLLNLGNQSQCTSNLLLYADHQIYYADTGVTERPLIEFTTFVVILTGAKCGKESSGNFVYTAYPAGGKNNFAVIYKLEGNGIICVDNS